MAQRPLTLNIENFVNPSTGKPIALGEVYIGEKDLDPLIEANRKTIVIVEETGVETTILPASQPLTLSAGGVIQYLGSPVVVLVDGVYSIKVLDSLSTQQYYVPRANEYLEESTDTGLLVLNGSFENTTVDATKPDSWVITETLTGTIEIDTADPKHGEKALKFTSVDASGAGSAVNTPRFPVAADRHLNISFEYKSTAVDTRTLVQITWYDKAGAVLSTSTLLDETAANPLTYDYWGVTVLPPANAATAEFVLQGMATGGTTMIGSTLFDNVIVKETGDHAFIGTIIGSGASPRPQELAPMGGLVMLDQIQLLINVAASVAWTTFDMSAAGGEAAELVNKKAKFAILLVKITGDSTNASAAQVAFGYAKGGLGPGGARNIINQFANNTADSLETTNNVEVICPLDENGDFDYDVKAVNITGFVSSQVYLSGYIY